MKIKELLDSPDKLCIGALARDKYDTQVGYDNINAYKWCILGGAAYCYSENFLKYCGVINKIKSYMYTNNLGNYIPTYNDNTPYEQIKNMLDYLDI